MIPKLTKKQAADNAATKALLDRTTDGYDPGPETRNFCFGLSYPKTATRAWGFRAIKEHGGFSLLYDRQSSFPEPVENPPEAEKKADKAFGEYLNKEVIPHLRRYAGWLYADDPRYYHFKFPAFEGQPCWAVISPCRSYGYIYGVVYLGSQ